MRKIKKAKYPNYWEKLDELILKDKQIVIITLNQLSLEF